METKKQDLNLLKWNIKWHSIECLWSRLETVSKGELLTDGSADIAEIFKYGSMEMAEDYIIREINKVYELQSASISKKHIEIIVRQMFSRRKITDSGQTNFSVGDIVGKFCSDRRDFRMDKLTSKGANTNEINVNAKAETVVLGITEVSLRTKSWLSVHLSKIQIVS